MQTLTFTPEWTFADLQPQGTHGSFGRSGEGLAGYPVTIVVPMVSVTWFPRGDVLVIVGSSLAASGVVLIRRSLALLPTKLRFFPERQATGRRLRWQRRWRTYPCRAATSASVRAWAVSAICMDIVPFEHDRKPRFPDRG